jgi:hypothetical protein
MALRTMSYNDVFAGKNFDLGKVEEEEERARREEAAEALLELRLNGGRRVFTQDLNSKNQSQQAQSQQQKKIQQPRQSQLVQQRQQPKKLQQS